MKSTAIPKKDTSTICQVSRRPDLKQVQMDYSSIGSVTNDVLRVHSSDTNKLICFGLSEETLSSIAQGMQPWDGFEKDFWISEGFRMHVRSKLFGIKIDFKSHAVIFAIKTCLVFYSSGQTPNVNDDKLAVVSIDFNVSAVPSLNVLTPDDQQLQLTFSGASYNKDDIHVNIIDLDNLVHLGCKDKESFKIFATNILEEIKIGKSNNYKTILPPIVECFPLPDQWNQQEGYRLNFEGFDYRPVIVGNVEVGYLFLIFNIESLMYSPPCVCRDEEVIIRRQTFEQEYQLLASIGFSRKALIEIALPLIDISKGHKNEKRWGPLYAKVSSHYTIHLAGASIDIHPDSVFTEVAAEADGSASAGFKEWTGQLNASAKLTIDVSSLQVTWSPVILRDKTNPNRLTVNLNPSILNMATPIIELRTDLPGWADKATSWILSNTVGQGLKDSIATAVAIGSLLGIFYFVAEDPEESNILYTYDHYELFERESLVIIGKLYYQYIG